MNSFKRRRWLRYGGLLAALLVILLVAFAAFRAMQVTFQNPTPSSAVPAVNCTPAPCANVQGYTLWVSNLTVNANLVEMRLTYKNSSDSTHASPEDLQLIDSNLHTSGLVTDTAVCQTFSRHEFNNGATYGPLNVCFRVTSAAPPLVLRWSPDLGLVCCQTDIKLT